MLRLVKQPVSLFSFVLVFLAFPFWWHFHRPMPVHAAVLTNVVDLNVDAEEQAFLGLINNYRAQNNAGPLACHPAGTDTGVFTASPVSGNRR